MYFFLWDCVCRRLYTWQIKHSHSTRCNKHNCTSVSEEWSYLLWKSIFSKEFLHQLHQLDGAVSLMLVSVLNIDFQRIYDNFSETPDSLFLLHSVQQPKSTHWQHVYSSHHILMPGGGVRVPGVWSTATPLTLLAKKALHVRRSVNSVQNQKLPVFYLLNRCPQQMYPHFTNPSG